MRPIIYALAFALGSIIPAFAQSDGDFTDAFNNKTSRASSLYKEQFICWGESWQGQLSCRDKERRIPSYGIVGINHIYDCPGGGWRSDVPCNDYCGVPYDKAVHCGVYTSNEFKGDGGKCGYRWAMVQCFH